MLSMQMQLHHLPFAVKKLQGPWIWASSTSYLHHGTSRPHSLIPVASIRQASSAVSENSPCNAVIILGFGIFAIVGNCEIAHLISDGVKHLVKCCFSLSGCHSCLVSISVIFLLWLNRWLCAFNSSCCHRGHSIHLILDLFLLYFGA